MYLADVLILCTPLYGDRPLLFRFPAQSMEQEYKTLSSILPKKEAEEYVTFLFRDQTFRVMTMLVGRQTTKSMNPSPDATKPWETPDVLFEGEIFRNHFHIQFIDSNHPAVSTSHLISLRIDRKDSWVNQLDRAFRQFDFMNTLSFTLPALAVGQDFIRPSQVC